MKNSKYMRKSSRGNPWHDKLGRFCHGPESEVDTWGKPISDEQRKEAIKYSCKNKEEYKKQTIQRFQKSEIIFSCFGERRHAQITSKLPKQNQFSNGYTEIGEIKKGEDTYNIYIERSSNGKCYAIKKEPKKIDLKSEEITEKFKESQTYEKTSEIIAKQAKRRQQIDTILKSGLKETTNIAEEGDYIITNPDGEKYVIKKDKFEQKYQKTEKTQIINGEEQIIYKPIGKIKAYQNDTGEYIQVIAPWGEIQYGDKDCYLAAQCDEEGTIGTDRYIIGKEEFESTYRSEKN